MCGYGDFRTCVAADHAGFGWRGAVDFVVGDLAGSDAGADWGGGSGGVCVGGGAGGDLLRAGADAGGSHAVGASVGEFPKIVDGSSVLACEFARMMACW